MIPISKSIENIREQLIDRVEYAQQQGWLPDKINFGRGPIRGLIEIWAWGVWQLYEYMRGVVSQAIPGESSGDWLDIHCQNIGINRYPSLKTKGLVYFGRKDTNGNIIIPKGRIVKTKPDGTGNIYRYYTLSEQVLTDGNDRIAVEVEAENAGSAYNVVVGMISEISTVVPGIDYVQNNTNWITIEGRDKETDAQLSKRYQLAWESLNGVTKRAYESWARLPGIEEVQVIDGHPRGQGTIDVIIRTVSGVPTPDVVQSVQDEIDLKKPINDNALVMAPEEIIIEVVGTIVVKPVYSADLAPIESAAMSHIAAIFQGDNKLHIGEDLTLERMISEVMNDYRVKTVSFDMPEGTVALTQYQIAVLSDLQLQITVASEL